MHVFTFLKEKVTDRNKVTNQLTWKWGDYPELPSKFNVLTRVFVGGSEGRGLEDSGRLEDAMLLTLKTDNKQELKEEGRP